MRLKKRGLPIAFSPSQGKIEMKIVVKVYREVNRIAAPTCSNVILSP